eukprot:280901-Pyramimonas_sp.AAC.1
MRSNRQSNCCWVHDIWWFSDCRNCCARDVPTPTTLNNITVRIWKLGIVQPAVSVLKKRSLKERERLVDPPPRLDANVDEKRSRIT